MKLKYDINLPITYGQIVKDYLLKLEEKTEYEGYTLTENLEIVKCNVKISNNGNYNYHNNYDDSELELYCKLKFNYEKHWFSLNKSEVIKLQKEKIKEWRHKLQEEIERIDDICQS